MKNITIKNNLTIHQAMKKLNHSGEKCLVIVDKNNFLMGTLSDGDIRKAILSGHGMNNSIQDIYQSKPTVLIKNKYTIDEARKLFIDKRFDIIPVINRQNKLIEILLFGDIVNNEIQQACDELNVPVIIMAGGKGTRMEPFTKVLPKPLIPIHEKPIIEHIIERFTNIGCSEFYLTVNYKGKILKAYFEELRPEYKYHLWMKRSHWERQAVSSI